MVKKQQISKKFPNGFDNWHETHYLITQEIIFECITDEPKGLVKTTSETEGQGGLFELAERLTDEFENLYKDKEWDGEYFDTIVNFTNKKLFGNDK